MSDVFQRPRQTENRECPEHGPQEHFRYEPSALWTCPRCAENAAWQLMAASQERLGLVALAAEQEMVTKMGRKETNPKDAAALARLNMSLLPPQAMIEWCLAQTEGALKYGAWNWRKTGVKMSVYIAAIRRHCLKLQMGEWVDPTTGINHLGYIMAGAAVVLDAMQHDKLEMDTYGQDEDMIAAGFLVEDFERRVKTLHRLFGPARDTTSSSAPEGAESDGHTPGE